MQKRCLNPNCNQLFNSIRVGELQCPGCRGVNKTSAQKTSTQSQAASSLSESQPVATVDANGFSRCLNAFCGASFQADAHTFYCPKCSSQGESKSGKSYNAKGAKVCITPECKQVFYTVGDSLICPLCERIQEKAEQESEEDAYEKIKDYLTEHQHATVDEIHVATKVPITRVKKMIDEGRFQLVLMPKCKQCNGPIVNGRPGQEMCVGCVQKMRDEMLKPIPPKEVRVSMHIQARDSGRGR